MARMTGENAHRRSCLDGGAEAGRSFRRSGRPLLGQKRPGAVLYSSIRSRRTPRSECCGLHSRTPTRYCFRCGHSARQLKPPCRCRKPEACLAFRAQIVARGAPPFREEQRLQMDHCSREAAGTALFLLSRSAEEAAGQRHHLQI